MMMKEQRFPKHKKQSSIPNFDFVGKGLKKLIEDENNEIYWSEAYVK